MGRYMVASRIRPSSNIRRAHGLVLRSILNVQIQRRISDHLEFGFYRASMNITATSYVLNVMAQVKHPTPPLEEKNLVNILARRFSQRTRVSTNTRGLILLKGLSSWWKTAKTLKENWQVFKRQWKVSVENVKRRHTLVESQRRGGQKETPFQRGIRPL